MRSLMKIFGINIYFHWSSLILVLVIGAGISSILYSKFHVGLLSYWYGFLIAISYIIFLLVHELSHALTGRLFGMRCENIVLFILGGVALSTYPKTPRDEFFAVIAGPLSNIIIGLFYLLPIIIFDIDPERSIECMSLTIIGGLNLTLGIFNLVPIYPLDGGRIIHSIIWKITNSNVAAAIISGGIGIFLSRCVMILGFLVILGASFSWMSGIANGIWIIVICSYIIYLAKTEIKNVVDGTLDG